MDTPESDPIFARISAAIAVEAFHPAPFRPLLDPDGRRSRFPLAELIERAESGLGVAFPDWLRAVYLACNGFSGEIGVCSMFRLDGDDGVLEFNLFLRTRDWAPSWFRRAVLFMDRRVSWSMNTHWAALEGRLIEWQPQEGERYTVLECDLFDLLKREQEWADRLRAEEPP